MTTLRHLSGARGPYLGKDIGALLQQGHWRVANARGQLDPEQLLLLGSVPLQRMGEGHSSAPV